MQMPGIISVHLFQWSHRISISNLYQGSQRFTIPEEPESLIVQTAEFYWPDIYYSYTS